MILLWYCRKRTESCGNRSFCRTFQKMHCFLEKCIKTCNNQQIKIKSVKANLQIRKFQCKNEDEKIWENEFNLWILLIKLSYLEIFMKICEKMSLTFWLFNFDFDFKFNFDEDGKNWCKKWRWRWENLQESIDSEFFISKLGYLGIVMNIWEKSDSFLKTFLTNHGKNEDINEKIWENKFDLWILHIKIRLYGNFHENLRKISWLTF